MASVETNTANEYFQDQGWSTAQSAGIVGNLQAESGYNLDPTAVGDGGQAYGIAQWHPPRQADFQKVFGKSIKGSSLQEQLAFVQWELTNTERKAGRILQQSNDPGQAAEIVDQYYERSSGEHRSKRIKNAKALARGGPGYPTTPGQPPGASAGLTAISTGARSITSPGGPNPPALNQVGVISQSKFGTSPPEDQTNPTVGTGSTNSKINFDPRPNPFKDFSTMTYSVSLYLLNTDQYNEFMRIGRKDVNGLTLILQSGGALPSGEVGLFGAKRSQFFANDYYIDDIQFSSLFSTKSTLGANNTFNLKFTITEPAGITLLDNLYQMVHTEMKKKNYATQPYLMVIRFNGYDETGVPIRGDQLKSVRESGSNPQYVSEKYIPFIFNNITFRLLAGKVVYSCEATCPQSQVPTDIKHGTIPASFSLSGSTLKEVLDSGNGKDGLMKVLNNHTKTIVEQKKYEVADEYEIIFEDGLGDYGVLQDGAQFLNTTPFDKKSNSSAVAFGSNIKAIVGEKKFEVTAGVNILKLIDVIMQTSKYITDQLSWNTEPADGKTTRSQLNQENLDWFKIKTEVEFLEHDNIRNQYAHKIIYIVSKITVNSDSEYIPDTEIPCIDIHKSYDYWFTGKNTEVLDFSQDYNFLYFTTMSSEYKDNRTRPMHYNLNSLNSTITNSMSYNSLGSEVYGSNESTNVASTVASDLYSPVDHAKVNVDIIGDPDLIAQGELFYSPRQMATSGFKNKMFLEDGSINYDNSEIHFVINYNTVADYDLSTGLAIPNTGSGKISGATGQPMDSKFSLLYRATQITTTLENGKFTQKIEGLLRSIKPKCLGNAPLPPGSVQPLAPESPLTPRGLATLGGKSNMKLPPSSPNPVNDPSKPTAPSPRDNQSVADTAPSGNINKSTTGGEGSTSDALVNGQNANKPEQSSKNQAPPVTTPVVIENAINTGQEIVQQANATANRVLNEVNRITEPVWTNIQRYSSSNTSAVSSRTRSRTNNEDDS